MLPFALQIKCVALTVTLPYPEEPFSTLFLSLLLQIWSASLLQRALQACLYSGMKSQPVFLKTASRHSENETVLSQSVCGKKRGSVSPEAGLMYQLELDAETFWIRIVCLQVGQSAGSMYTGLPITPCSPASWLVLSYM